MESPPRPKRLIKTFDNLLPFPSPDLDISDSLKEIVPITNNVALSSMTLQSLSTKPVVPKEGPNLCAFVNEVAAQQQQQIDELGAQKLVLESRIKEVNSLKNQHEIILIETKSVRRRTFLAQEESNVQRNKITHLRDEILLLLNEEKHICKNIEATQSKDFQNLKKNYLEKMKFHEEKVKANAYDTNVGNQIANSKSNIAKYHEETQKVISSLNNTVSTNQSQIQQKISNLKSEKIKLLGILHRKKKALQEEDKQIQSLRISVKNSQKHVTAQKLRLRSRIGEKRRLMQQFEEEAAALQIEIDDLTSEL